MAGAALLTPGDVSVIRRYVRTKYAPMPATRQAEIVADAVVRTIRKRLPDWPEALRDEVAGRLVASCVVGERRDVYADDVLRVCADLTLAEEAHVASLLRWLNERTAAEWTPERIAERTEQGFVLKPGLAESRASVDTALDSASSDHRPLGDMGADAADIDDVRRGRDSHADYAVQTNAEVGGSPGRGWLAPAAIRPLVLSAVLLFALTGALLASLFHYGNGAQPRSLVSTSNPSPARPSAEQADAQAGFAYSPFDAEAVRAYLAGRDSLLAERPYFEAIVESARLHSVDPLLLFAVAGQEQGFVPKSAKKSKQIANNPFNVFHSWETYNTNIRDSSGIAAKLLAKLAAGVPDGEEPFAWMNRTYAEDPRWSDGVRAIYDKLVSIGRAKEEEAS